MDELRRIRHLRGMSQEDLAQSSGVSDFTISELEGGKRPNPRPSTLRKLAAALGVEVAALYGEEVPGPKVTAPPSLAEWLEERCGHAYLAMSKDELEEMFDGFPEDSQERQDLGLQINDEYNTFCAFPRNVTTQERLSMRKMIRDSISEIAVKHGLALHESGLYSEYAEEIGRVFELERTLDAETA